MIKLMNTTIVIFRSKDPYQLPIAYRDTIEECAKWIGCTPQALYKNHKINGYFEAKGYRLELVIFDKLEG